MKIITTPLSRLIPLFIAIIFASCTSERDSLDAVRDYRPDDKYFKSGLVSLHFLTEVSPIPKVDSAYSEMIAHYDLALDAEGAKDGTYTGSSPRDAFDYRHEATITIRDEMIVDIDYNEVNREGEGKEEDEAYCKEMSIAGTTPAIAYPLMEKQLLETQDLGAVDAVSGATYSFYRFRFAVMVALMKANI